MDAAGLSSHIESFSLTDIIRLQNQLSSILTRRFERFRALAFSDIVGSTTYCAKFGDEAGRRLQQRHLDFFNQTLAGSNGRIVDTAGDGAFFCFPELQEAVDVFTKFYRLVFQQNCRMSQEHALVVRSAIHWGRVLTDDVIVTGDAVNLCARVAATANGGQIRITKSAFAELNGDLRLCCRPLPSVNVKGFVEPVAIVELDWRESCRLPRQILLEETGERITLPDQPIITFGRLREINGGPANDIVLSLPDNNLTQQISRWHFKLRRESDRLFLRPLSNQLTEVNGRPIAKDDEVSVECETVVRLAKVLTLRFLANVSLLRDEDATGFHKIN